VLCAITDWTIRLIVVNAKLSGRSSYIDIMTACFGSSGRAAVSFFQFAFAFGGGCLHFQLKLGGRKWLTYLIGMCAFGIIIGPFLPWNSIESSNSIQHQLLFRRYNPPGYPHRLPFSLNNTRTVFAHQPTIRHCAVHALRLLPALLVPGHPQALPSLRPRPRRHARHRLFRPL
jgi:hypothetical protein